MLHRRSFCVALLLFFLGLLPLSVHATYTDNPPAQPGFTHTPKLSFDDTLHGKILTGAAIGYGSPTIAEVDGNTGNGKEIVIGGIDGYLYAYRSNGALLWERRVTSQCAANYPDGAIDNAPAVGDLEGDGVPDVVVGYGGIITNCTGGVIAYNGKTGAEKWRYQLTSPTEGLHSVYSSPALADVDGDGKLEVGFGNFERDFVLLNSTGTKRWRYHNADTVFSSPAFTDVDGDDLPDMIIGSDISANPKMKPPTFDGGYVTALRGLDSTVLWRVYFNQTIFSSPALADVDDDGVLDVVIGSGCNFSPATLGHWLKILDLHTGATKYTLNASGCVSSSPAVGDLDEDGNIDIVAQVDGSQVSGPGVVQMWRYNNPTPRWTSAPGESFSGGANLNDLRDRRSPIVADIDGNGSLEVLVTNWKDVVVLSGKTGAQLTCKGCANSTKALYAGYPLQSTPAAGDLDGDGDLEVVVGGSRFTDPGAPFASGTRGLLYVWTNITGLSSPGTLANDSAPWPMFRGSDPKHTGIFVEPALRTSATAISQIVEQGASARTMHISVVDAADGAIDWTATDNQTWISLGDTSGTTPSTLDVTINPSALALGTHTGTITFNSSVGKPDIDVTVRVVDEVFTVYLPMTQR